MLKDISKNIIDHNLTKTISA